MRPGTPCLLLAVLLGLALGSLAQQREPLGAVGPGQPLRRRLSATAGRQAYATLLYSDAFLLGVRVLGQSLRETGTKRDLVVLVTESVSQQAADTLATDGWKVQRVSLVANPGTWSQDAEQKFPQRFHGVYTKLKIFNLTQYERVVYLDADAIAARSLDELFLCDGLCAAMRHSERFNTGVMALTPSAALLDRMLRAIASTPSYTGGDQGFLNAFLADFAEAPLFDPRRGQRLTEASSWRSSAPGAEGMALGRLPTVYNADLGLFIVNSNRWTLPPQEIRVIHYTLATFKPWDWWAGWIMGEASARWQALRSRLPKDAAGRSGGRSAQQAAAAALLPAPLLLAALVARRRLWRAGLGAAARGAAVRLRCTAGAAGGRARALLPVRQRGGSAASTPRSSPQVSLRLEPSPGGAADASGATLALPAAAAPAWLPAAAAAAGVGGTAAALGASLALIPRQVAPWLGWTLAYELTALGTTSLFALFLQACHRLARGPAPPGGGGAPGSGATRPWGASAALLAAVVASLGLVPWWADLLGIRLFAMKAIATFVLGALTAIVCTQCFISLAARWYACGAVEAALARAAAKLGV